MNKDKGYVIFSPRQAPRPTLRVPNAEKKGPTDPTVVMLLERVRESNNIEVTKKSVALLLKLIMECVENEGLNGERAKETVLEIAEVVIEEKAPASEKEWLLDAVRDEAISGLIDLVVAASKNEVDLNQSKKVGKKCVPCIFKAVARRLSMKSRTKTSSPRSSQAAGR